jgi:hypothetical protein
MKSAILIAVLSAGVFTLVMNGGDPVKPLSSEVQGYRAWKKVNKQRAKMDEIVSALCRADTAGSAATVSKSSPHHAYITVWVNAIGAKAMDAKNPIFPVGTIIVKEKFRAANTSKVELLTVMRKREARFARDSGDWEYLVVSPRGKALKTDVNACKSCHQQMRADDFVFRSYHPNPQVSRYWSAARSPSLP